MDRGFQEPRANAHNKFPPDYLFELDAAELDDLRTKISSTNLSSKSRALPKAFTEKGLYMLATVLKSRRATETRKIRKNPSARIPSEQGR